MDVHSQELYALLQARVSMGILSAEQAGSGSSGKATVAVQIGKVQASAAPLRDGWVVVLQGHTVPLTAIIPQVTGTASGPTFEALSFKTC